MPSLESHPCQVAVTSWPNRMGHNSDITSFSEEEESLSLSSLFIGKLSRNLQELNVFKNGTSVSTLAEKFLVEEGSQLAQLSSSTQNKYIKSKRQNYRLLQTRSLFVLFVF